MSCDDVMRLVEEVFDGEAGLETREHVRSHLSGCERCRAHESFLRTVELGLLRSRPDGPSDTYWEEFPPQVAQRARRSEVAPLANVASYPLLSPGVLRYGAAAASVLLVVAIAAFVYRGAPPSLEGTLAPPTARDEMLDAGERGEAEARVEESSRAAVVGDGCDSYRSRLEDVEAAGSLGRDLRYELALCAVLAYESRPSEAARLTALSESTAFLRVEPDGPRAAAVSEEIVRLER